MHFDPKIQIIRELDKQQIAVVFGEAGTGKTTILISVIQELLDRGTLIKSGFVLCSYTNAAVRRIKDRAPAGWKCSTLHKLLEFKPAKGVDDSLFLPTRDESSPLSGLQLIAIDEISMVPTSLYQSVRDALPHYCLILLLGDAEQVPPVAGEGIISHVLGTSWISPIVLTEQWRQSAALLKFARTILQGQPPEPDKRNGVRILDGGGIPNDRRGYTKVTAFLEEQDFQPGTDILLCPIRTPSYSISCYHLAKWIADKALGKRHGSAKDLVEILPFDGLYLALGDIVSYQNEEWRLVQIDRNPFYSGDTPATGMSNRYGHHRKLSYDQWWPLSLEDRKPTLPYYYTELSHSLSLENIADPSIFCTVSALPEQKIDDFLYLSGATTIHKSQGNEWNRVFLLTLAAHNHMCNRQLLYTAATRARQEIIWITSKGPRYYGVKKSSKPRPSRSPLNLLPRSKK